MAKKATKKTAKKAAGRTGSKSTGSTTRKRASAKPSGERSLSGLTADDIMETDVLTVSRSTPLSEVERLLSEHSIGGVPVTDEAGHIVGVISIRDLIERYTQDPDSRPRRGQGFYQLASQDMLDEDLEAFEVPAESEETAGELMTAQVFSVKPETPVRNVARKMFEHNIHRILVQDGGGFTIGLITTTDILRAVARHG